MPTPGTKLTDPAEIAAYVLAHGAGLTWGIVVNPRILRSLLAQGQTQHFVLAAIALSIAVSLVVLLIFLVLRKAMSGAGAPPPPADRPAPPAEFTNGREITAYVLAHAAGIAWGATVTPLIFRSLIAQGHHDLMLTGLTISIAVSLAVLLIFLFLRKAMVMR
jgi:hypothetical protein